MPSVKLNLGCGKDIKKGYINIDAQLPCDIQHNFINPLPFKDGTVDEIYSHDVIQHFSRKEWAFIKKDWIRVLRPGGILYIHCWDFAWVLSEFLSHRLDPYAMQRIYAGQENEFDYFKNGFTYEKLISDLEEEGMTKFSREPFEECFIHLLCKKSS